jgi:hypothetical protein
MLLERGVNSQVAFLWRIIILFLSFVVLRTTTGISTVRLIIFTIVIITIRGTCRISEISARRRLRVFITVATLIAEGV